MIIDVNRSWSSAVETQIPDRESWSLSTLSPEDRQRHASGPVYARICYIHSKWFKMAHFENFNWNKLIMNIETHVILNKITKHSLLLKLDLDLTLKHIHFYLDVQISQLNFFFSYNISDHSLPKFDGSWCLNNNQLFCKIIYFHNIFQRLTLKKPKP